MLITEIKIRRCAFSKSLPCFILSFEIARTRCAELSAETFRFFVLAFIQNRNLLWRVYLLEKCKEFVFLTFFTIIHRIIYQIFKVFQQWSCEEIYLFGNLRFFYFIYEIQNCLALSFIECLFMPFFSEIIVISCIFFLEFYAMIYNDIFRQLTRCNNLLTGLICDTVFRY